MGNRRVFPSAVSGVFQPSPVLTAATLPRVPWEGGPAYYGRFNAPSARGWTSPGFFPIGVWYESVIQQSDIDLDRGAGLNTYVFLSGNSNLGLIRDNNMNAVIGYRADAGPETVGWFIADEADMMYAAGEDPWSGVEGWNTCIPIQDAGGKCGYTYLGTRVEQFPADGRFRQANFGKGVMFWMSDHDAARFVNGYTDVVSVDNYWYTDNDVCTGVQGPTRIPGSGPISPYSGLPDLTPTECHRAANYGVTVDRMRSLDAMDGRLQPVWAFVELAHPGFDPAWPTITPPQVGGAVWASLIHEARGVIYFNHSFAGCVSNGLLRDSCGTAVRPVVTAVNSQIRQLAAILNTQSYRWSFNPALNTMLKLGPDGAWYVFAMLRGGTPAGSYAFSLPGGIPGSAATVLFENRAVSVTSSGFTDSFAAEYTYHIYRIGP